MGGATSFPYPAPPSQVKSLLNAPGASADPCILHTLYYTPIYVYTSHRSPSRGAIKCATLDVGFLLIGCSVIIQCIGSFIFTVMRQQWFQGNRFPTRVVLWSKCTRSKPEYSGCTLVEIVLGSK